MNSRIAEKPEQHFIGRETRTSNEAEFNPETGKIPGAWESFFKLGAAEAIPQKIADNQLYGLYSDYASDEKGQYSFSIGTIVKNTDSVPEGFVVKTLLASKYLVFKTEKGPMPAVVIAAWQHIWKYFDGNPEYIRTYTGDYELYGEDARDPENTSLEIYIAVE
ncbi:MAG: AraC family transcriptional regulator [Alphaproteobacteria bacterium]|jgi:predicted transcriptional regulator YdeE|nr:AraC family transcriptional regulator [Alphaproteobacteria bacterium]MBT5389368.1 AraC family transcriptional regulator [Alphaproteobacteria bacterium]MBT5540558.1 AraC family transcriptional regulator [Alphaproteobacteria bacterium]MBT5654037.1 AraC family transcriptional regulator [Alphaproteobacteria bacterium]